ncbi:MAG: histidine kinase [Lachnospiraceae bacterium]|nr:histidine kinase [Lachnospiraceae bacterium]
MTDFILSYIVVHYVLVIALISILLISMYSKSMGKKELFQMRVMFVVILLQSVCDFQDEYLEINRIENLGTLNFFATTIGCILKPSVVVLLGSVLIRPKKKGLEKYLFYVPACINVIIYLVSIRTGLAFYITETGTVGKGPLFETANVISFVYVCLYSIFAAKLWKEQTNLERVILYSIVLELGIGAIMDIVTSGNRMNLTIMMALATCLLYYYVQRNNEIIKKQGEELEQKKDELMISQIQPHFIYNTLNVIYRLCQVDPKTAGDTIVEFSNYLRKSLESSANGTKYVDIDKEIEHVKFYLDIEKLRFPYLEITYDIEDGGYMIPPLTIQPMVENAVRHGVRGMKDGHIWIKAYRDVNEHIIIVQDNGKGKPSEEIRVGEHKGIGIKNVTDRIESFCEGTVTINMEEDKGTTVTIRIPLNHEIKE